MRARLWRWYVLPLVALAAPTSAARAGNFDSILVGNTAAMTGGAVVSTVRGGESAWYNPAGLAASRAVQSVDVSASAFALRMRRVPGLLRVRIGDNVEGIDVSSTDLVSVPSALVYTRRLSEGLWGGVGLFVLEQDAFSVRDTATVGSVLAARGRRVPLAIRQHLGGEIAATLYEGGAAIGWQATRWLRVGGGVFVGYAHQNTRLEYWVEGDVGANRNDVIRAVNLQSTTGTITALGVQAVGAVQLAFSGFRAGLVVRSPLWLVASFDDAATTQIDATNNPQGPPATNVAYFENKDRALGFDTLRPLRLVGGLGFDWGHGWVNVEGDWSPSWKPPGEDRHNRAVWNARVGATFDVGSSWVLGAGLFTDRSANPEPVDPGDDRVHYYGGTFGVQFDKSYGLKEEKADRLVFRTVIALRYALGLGQWKGLDVDVLDDSRETTRSIDVRFHELSLHLGSALLF